MSWAPPIFSDKVLINAFTSGVTQIVDTVGRYGPFVSRVRNCSSGLRRKVMVEGCLSSRNRPSWRD